MSKSTQIDISAENTTLGKKGFKGWLAENCYIILAFFVPFLILGTAFALYEVYPFGDKQTSQMPRKNLRRLDINFRK